MPGQIHTGIKTLHVLSLLARDPGEPVGKEEIVGSLVERFGGPSTEREARRYIAALREAGFVVERSSGGAREPSGKRTGVSYRLVQSPFKLG